MYGTDSTQVLDIKNSNSSRGSDFEYHSSHSQPEDWLMDRLPSRSRPPLEQRLPSNYYGNSFADSYLPTVYIMEIKEDLILDRFLSKDGRQVGKDTLSRTADDYVSFRFLRAISTSPATSAVRPFRFHLQKSPSRCVIASQIWRAIDGGSCGGLSSSSGLRESMGASAPSSAARRAKFGSKEQSPTMEIQTDAPASCSSSFFSSSMARSQVSVLVCWSSFQPFIHQWEGSAQMLRKYRTES